MDKVTADALAIDPEQVAKEIEESLRGTVSRELHRRGGVVGVSGGIDSSVTVGLSARAFGPRRTLALLMPEADSDPDTLNISRQVAEAFGVETVVEDITEILQATGCYEQRTAVPDRADDVEALLEDSNDAVGEDYVVISEQDG